MAEEKKSCVYHARGHTTRCGRTPYANSSNYCIFHSGINKDATTDDLAAYKSDFDNKLVEEIKNKNGDWKGFIFPENFGKHINTFDFDIDARYSSFGNVYFEAIKFKKKFDISKSKFSGKVVFNNCIFDGDTSFEKCQFEGEVKLLSNHFKSEASFYESRFLDRVLLKVIFEKSVNFDWTVFEDEVLFLGWRSGFGSLADAAGYQNPSELRQIELLSKDSSRRERENYQVFKAEASLSNVVFKKPNQVMFTNVDMAKARISSSSFRGVRFLGVNWYQDELKRNGLYEEVIISRLKNEDDIKAQMPQLEESYRNIRITLENNLNYTAAADFYIGEMDAQRKQLNKCQKNLFSVLALYRIVSNYGTSVSRAFGVLLTILLLHIFITLCVNYEISEISLGAIKDSALRTFSSFTYQRPNVQNRTVEDIQQWADIGLKLFGLSQLTMLVFAFRSRIKRH